MILLVNGETALGKIGLKSSKKLGPFNLILSNINTINILYINTLLILILCLAAFLMLV